MTTSFEGMKSSFFAFQAKFSDISEEGPPYILKTSVYVVCIEAD